MKILLKLLNGILSFQLQLLNDLWFENEKTKEIEHKSFAMLQETHKKFKSGALFIFKSIIFKIVNFIFKKVQLSFSIQSFTKKCFSRL